jgi:PAS domain-containing protein
MGTSEIAGWFALAMAVVVLVMAVRRRVADGVASRAADATRTAHERNSEESHTRQQRDRVRSLAFDAVGEAVLITTPDGRVSDCNSAAMTLFDRHRSDLEDAFVTSLRTLERSGSGDGPYDTATSRALWTGESWIREADGSVRLCLTRIVPVRDVRGDVQGFVEGYRDVVADHVVGEELRDLLYMVRREEAELALAGSSVEDAAADDLRQLGRAFRDLERVMQQYDRLLPELSAQDPLTESIAGVASDAQSAASDAGLTGLLGQIPRTLARLRAGVERMSKRDTAHQPRQGM